METKPLALLLRRVVTAEDAKANTDDFAVSFPLAMGSHPANLHALSPAVLCADCVSMLRTCPFSRLPITVLPLRILDLAHKVNFGHFREVRRPVPIGLYRLHHT